MKISNFQINKQKSEFLNITVSQKEFKQLVDNNSMLREAKQAIKYLGTVIPRELSEIHRLNFETLEKEVTLVLKKGFGQFHSWFRENYHFSKDIVFASDFTNIHRRLIF